MLLGRHGERVALDQLLGPVRAGGSRALVVRGESGASKTALLNDLRTAHNSFTAMEMEAFAQRAEGELLATGEHVRRRSVSTISDLTAQEIQSARLAGDGLTNAEIASRLFISPRPVEWHWARIFAKLEITSRRQLQRR